MINHSFFSNLALNLAENNLGKTNSNPSVGCIVVKNSSVISSGVTSLRGRPHAEFNALNFPMNFKGSNLYVTLEPCSHHGLTPPCTNIIKKKKIKNVFYSFNDPDPRTFGKAKKEFNKSKIIFKRINTKRKNFYKSYFLNKKKYLPLLDAKIAFSNDFKSINRKSKRITNERSNVITHLLRSKYDSIISTSKTINKDNALLNCRIMGMDNAKPDLLIIDRDLKIKTNLNFLNLSNKRKTYIFTKSNNIKKIKILKKKKCKIIKINKLENKNDFLKLLNKIFKLGKRRILIESGLIFLSKLLKLKLINELYFFKSNKNLNSKGYNNINIDKFKRYKLKVAVKVNLNNDKLFKVRA